MYNLSIHPYAQKRTTLRNIIGEHVKPSSNSKRLTLLPYYRPLKLSNIFTTRTSTPPLQRTNVVYRFSCNMPGCQAAYVGHTTCRLERRSKQHRYKSSSIYSHITEDHQEVIPPQDEFSSQFEVIHQYTDTIRLKIAESLTIREDKPIINVKYNEIGNFLNLYK